ncbi:MAG: response regulator [Chitinispirillaceae bacterium]|nr:response regulator [Chitinispirillaceae bacterium]
MFPLTACQAFTGLETVLLTLPIVRYPTLPCNGGVMEYSILLLDDDEDLLELTRCNLESINHLKILPFSDPFQALRRIHLFELPDLIITDLDLPGMNGIDFLAEVMRLHPAVAAIIFTGHPEALPRNCRYPVILKEPNAYEHLVAMVESILSQSAEL